VPASVPRCQTVPPSDQGEHNGYHESQRRPERATNINWLVRVLANYIGADVIQQHLTRIHGAFAWRQHLPQSRPDLGRSAKCRQRSSAAPWPAGPSF
jgi:hypothetical protein